jgi:hypothetical protein
LLSVNEFEKQKYMTTEQLITKAEKWLIDETGGNCSNLSRKQAAKAMAYFHQHLLQQTPCTTPLPQDDNGAYEREKERLKSCV